MQPLRVLLADDHALVRAGIRALVEKIEGVEVVGQAGDGHEAVQLIRKHRPDIVLLRQRNAEVDRLAYYDALTDLPNRSFFEDRLDQAVAVAQRSGGTLAILFISPDQLKKVNDTLGHCRGDRLLGEVGERLRGCITKSDTVARFSADANLRS